jgi:hypothetical protein
LNENSSGRYLVTSSFGVEAWWGYEHLSAFSSNLQNLEKVERPDDATVAEIFCNKKVQSDKGAGLNIKLTPLDVPLLDMIKNMKVTHPKYLNLN